LSNEKNPYTLHKLHTTHNALKKAKLKKKIKKQSADNSKMNEETVPPQMLDERVHMHCTWLS